MPEIHPTAIIDPLAELAPGVRIGPNCIIEGKARLAEGVHLIANVYLQGPATIGPNCKIYPFACVGMAPQDRKFDPAQTGGGIVLGEGNTLREYVTIHRGCGETPTTIGNRNYFMVNSHVGHDANVGNNCTFANGVLLAGHVCIADGATMGGNSAVHQYCRMGRLSMISGLAAVTQDLPPFCIAYELRSVGSLNLVGLRRAGYRDHIVPLKRAFDILYRSQHANAAACDIIECELGDDPLCMELAQFVRESKRGITHYCGIEHPALHNA